MVEMFTVPPLSSVFLCTRTTTNSCGMSGADGAAPGNDGHPGFLTPDQDAKVAALKGMISATMASPEGQHLVRINGGEQVELCR